MTSLTNNINYYSHATYAPATVHRQYERDLPSGEAPWWKTAKRVGMIAIPFLSLYKPIGQGLSIGMGAIRCYTHLSAAGLAAMQGDVLRCLWEVFQAAISVLAFVGMLFSFHLGLLISNIHDTVLSLIDAVQYLLAGEYKKALEQLLQALLSAVHVVVMLVGALEIVIVSFLLKGLLCCYQAFLEGNRGRWPEFIAKLLMGGISMFQGMKYIEMLERRNKLLSLDKYIQLMRRVKRGRDVQHLKGSELHERNPDVVLLDAEGNAYSFGDLVNGFGEGTVKGMNLQFRTHQVNGKTMTELDFKVNHVFRDRLQVLIEGLSDFSEDEMQEFLQLTNSHADGVKIEKVPFELKSGIEPTVGPAYKITLVGLGSMTVGGTKIFPNVYDRVRVEIDQDKSLYEMHELLAFFNLDEVLHVSKQDDIERLKIGQLFRVFHPQEATLFERTEDFFSLSVEELKARIVAEVPEMDETFSSYLENMEAREILPGRIRYCIPGLADRARELGARGLISTLTGSDEESYERLASILKMGMLSSETRFSNGVGRSGLSFVGDFYTGGADSVYTQLVTERNCADGTRISEFYWGNVRLLYSLDVLETGTYQYHDDNFGIRIADGDVWWADEYLERPNILDFVAEETREFNRDNEVMVKERIPPEMIRGVVVPDMRVRDELLTTLRGYGLLTLGDSGQEMVMGKSVDEFIHVSPHITEELFA